MSQLVAFGIRPTGFSRVLGIKPVGFSVGAVVGGVIGVAIGFVADDILVRIF